MRVYFDNAATTPILEEVVDTMVPFMKNMHGNPSSIHADGRQVKAALEEARKKIAQLMGASIGEIFFTSGGTESNNMALKCAVRDLDVTRIITSPTEHHCILHCLDKLAEQGILIDYMDVDSKGRIDTNQLRSKLQDDSQKTMVSLMHGNNEIGTMIDLEEVSEICAEANAFFHSDTVQTIGHFPFDLSKTKMSFLSAGAHKFHGPKGVGFIYINGDNMIQPFIDGGAQERNMRGGTENIYGIIGMAKALEIAYTNLNDETIHIRNLRDTLKSRLTDLVEGITFNGDIDGQNLFTVLSASFPSTPKSDMLLMALDMQGVSASGGSACSSGAEQQSHVLQAIGSDPARRTVRFSFSKLNKLEEIDFLINKLKEIIPTAAAV